MDAAFDPDSGKGGTGAVIRDSGGNFIAASCSCTEFALDAAAMETSALLEGLHLAEQFGAQSLLVESDSMEVVEAANCPFEFRGTAVVVIDDCRQLLRSHSVSTRKKKTVSARSK